MTRDKADGLIFDIDGVLVDVSLSYPMVIRTAIQWAWRFLLGRRVDKTAFRGEHLLISKRHPAFNDDYDTAWALLCAAASTGKESLRAAFPSPKKWEEELARFRGDDIASWVKERFGEAMPRESMRRLCQELYFGQKDMKEILGEEPRFVRIKGLYRLERPLVQFHWRALPLPVGIYTGRPLSECRLVLRLLNWEDLPRSHMVTLDDGALKPSPKGLELLCERLSVSNPLYFGDAESDRESLRRFGRGRFIAIGPFLKDDPFHFPDVQSALVSLGFMRSR
jgi:HAD superfamily hydrolase (TIGR01549 family)